MNLRIVIRCLSCSGCGFSGGDGSVQLTIYFLATTVLTLFRLLLLLGHALQVKKAAAETEEAWHGAGEAVGLNVWRIEKFQVSSAFV